MVDSKLNRSGKLGRRFNRHPRVILVDGHRRKREEPAPVEPLPPPDPAK